MEEGNAAPSKGVVVVFARKVYMVELSTVLPMVGAKDVLYLSAQRVQEGGPTIVFVMVVEKDASMRDVEKVRKAAQIFARHMAVVSDALGASGNQMLVVSNVTALREVRLDSVLHIAPCCTTVGSMVGELLEQLFKMNSQASPIR